MQPPFNTRETLTNTTEFSVSGISQAIKAAVEGAFSHVRVRGELSKVMIAKSGHLYTALKDDAAVLDAVCWKGTLQRLGIKPAEGMDVVCTGRITTYPGRSNYQLVIDSMELAGIGAILKMLEERKKKLAAEGLFAPERKKKLPAYPTKIGVVTSPTGAVIRDILHRLSDRFPCHVLVWPVAVQGESAAREIVRGIEGFNAMDEAPDIIVVARGGGSFEDLMPFNDEAVVRAAAGSRIPLISAVGHETDVTIIDFAADLRAPTPTAAAELAVPVLAQIMATLLDSEQRLVGALGTRLEAARLKLDASARLFETPARLLEMPSQRLDRATLQAEHAWERLLMNTDARLARSAGRLRTPTEIVNMAGTGLKNMGERLTFLREKILETHTRETENLARMLESLSFKKVLERGYAVLRGEDGRVLSRKAQLSNNINVKITLHDGDSKARITN